MYRSECLVKFHSFFECTAHAIHIVEFPVNNIQSIQISFFKVWIILFWGVNRNAAVNSSQTIVLYTTDVGFRPFACMLVYLLESPNMSVNSNCFVFKFQVLVRKLLLFFSCRKFSFKIPFLVLLKKRTFHSKSSFISFYRYSIFFSHLSFSPFS